MDRRNFIKQLAATSGSLSFGSSLSLLSSSASAASPSFNGYKAIVLVNLDGGNDSMNMFVPTGSEAQATYETVRGSLAVANTNLYNDDHYGVDNNEHFTASLGDNQPYFPPDPVANTEQGAEMQNREKIYRKGSYQLPNHDLGIHALMPELASLYKKGALSIVSNAGTLVQPTTKVQIEAETAQLPLFLFAHNHQRRAVSTVQADILGSTGWAGRLADRWQLTNPVGLNISYAGTDRVFMGSETSSLTMKPAKPASYKQRSSGDSLESLLNRLADNTDSANHFDRYYHARSKSTAALSTLLTQAWESSVNPDFTNFTAKNAYGENLFTSYQDDHQTKIGMRTHHGIHSDFIAQLESAAKMIKISKDRLNNQRQIFYVRGGGFDSHSNQVDAHSRNLRTISLGISDFYKALEEMGLEDQVLVISTSEFGRTMRNNGDGTDHGWGGHSFMMSGDTTFNGGETFGEIMTDLRLEGVNAYTDRSRIIPTTSIEQMLAPALRWFGVDDATMAHVLPNLSNFETTQGDIGSAFLQDVFSV